MIGESGTISKLPSESGIKIIISGYLSAFKAHLCQALPKFQIKITYCAQISKPVTMSLHSKAV